MFYFRIDRIKIFDNKESPSILGLFGSDLAQVKLISFVTTDAGQLPDMTNYLATNDESQRKKFLKEAVSQVVSTRVLTTIDNVKDGHIMTFGDTGYVLFKSDKIPDSLDWQFIAYESDNNIRKVAQMTKDIINDSSFDTFSNNLAVVIGTVINPAYTAAVEIGKFAINVIGDIARKNEDDMIGILYMSLDRIQHYPHGIRNRSGIPDITNNMLVDYSIFGYE